MASAATPEPNVTARQRARSRAQERAQRNAITAPPKPAVHRRLAPYQPVD